MPNSAFLGESPLSQNDKYIYRAMLIISPSEINPVKEYPFGPPKPEIPSSDSHARSMVIGQCFAIAFVLIITSFRLYIRKYKLRAWGLDDWVVIPGALACCAYLIVDILQETKGCLGKHQYNCTYEEMNWYAVLGQINESMFYFCAFTIKTSIAIANGRITGLDSRKWRLAFWVYLSIVLILLPISVFLNMFPCTPIPPSYSLIKLGALKDPRVVKCLDKNAISLAIRAVHITTDWILLSVPLLVIYRLDTSFAKKCRLAFVFCIGAVSSIASIVRNTIVYNNNADFTYNSFTLYAWDVLDIAFATIVASLPALNMMVDVLIVKVRKLLIEVDGKTFGLLRRTTASDSLGIDNSRFTEVIKDEAEISIAPLNG